jgi:hypothetical protein
LPILRRWGRISTTPTKSTTESRRKLSRRTTLLTVTGITTSIATITVTSRSTTSTRTPLTIITTHHATRRSVRALLLDVGCWDDLGGEMKPLSEIVEAFRREGVVVPLPGELGLEVAAGGQGLAGLDDLNRIVSTWDVAMMHSRI